MQEGNFWKIRTSEKLNRLYKTRSSCGPRENTKNIVEKESGMEEIEEKNIKEKVRSSKMVVEANGLQGL